MLVNTTIITNGQVKKPVAMGNRVYAVDHDCPYVLDVYARGARLRWGARECALEARVGDYHVTSEWTCSSRMPKWDLYLGPFGVRHHNARLTINVLGRGNRHDAKMLDTISIPIAKLQAKGGYVKREFTGFKNNCKVQLELTIKDARTLQPRAAPVVMAPMMVTQPMVVTESFVVQSVPPPVVTETVVTEVRQMSRSPRASSRMSRSPRASTRMSRSPRASARMSRSPRASARMSQISPRPSQAGRASNISGELTDILANLPRLSVEGRPQVPRNSGSAEAAAKPATGSIQTTTSIKYEQRTTFN